MATTKEILAELNNDLGTKGQKIDNLTTGLKRTESYMIGISIVTGFGLITLLLTGWSFFSNSLNFKASTYQSLIDKVNETNQKIDTQNEYIYKEQINNIQYQISDLKEKNPYLK